MIEHSNTIFTIKKPKKNIINNVTNDQMVTSSIINENNKQYQIQDESKNGLNHSKTNSKTHSKTHTHTRQCVFQVLKDT